jgi:hypothetical protein
MPQSRTYFLFAGLNLIWIPIVYLCKLRHSKVPTPSYVTSSNEIVLSLP